MLATLISAELERFRGIIARRLGLHFDDTKLGLLEEVLQRRVDANGRMLKSYLERLEFPDLYREELRILAQELTVTETYFFRNPDQFRAFSEVALPERMRTRSGTRKLRLLSAGCASGEEAYSLAILIREHLPSPAIWDVSIRAVDLNTAMLEKADRARYSAWSLRETSAEIQTRWFRPEGRELVLDASVRAMVAFEERNLVEDDPELWQPKGLDIVFCRNVVMYFSPANAEAVIGGISRALTPGGFLFLGHAETLRGLSNDFHLRHTHGTFYYQRKDPTERPEFGGWAAAEPSHAVPTASPLAVIAAAADSWVETIRRATERIQSLTQPPSALALKDQRAGVGPASGRARWDLGLALELLRKERFADALTRMRDLPPESALDPDVLLLRAALMTHSGELEEAERVCADLLALDEMNAGAHYLTALCREAAGDRKGAGDHDQVAVYLDPGFAMPRLHLGLLARRAGDQDAARREIGQALALLQREDASRLLLFGGGFSREALVALCRAELAGCGATR